jgi:predicted ATPase
MKLTELHVEGYRSLVNVSAPLRALTVMIGPNGSGKSSVLEIFELMKGGAQENLAQTITRMGGVNTLLSRAAPQAESLRFRLAIDYTSSRSSEPAYYSVELTPTAVGYNITTECLEWHYDQTKPKPHFYIDSYEGRVRYRAPDAGGFLEPNWDYDSKELALAQIPRMYVEQDTLRTFLSKIELYSFLDVGRRAVVRLPQALTPATRPGPNGENLYSALYNMRTQYMPEYSRLLDVMKLAFPGFERLEFPVVGAGQVTLAWHQSPLIGPLYPNDLSEGTLRFLWLVTLLLSPDPAPLTLVDEPEVSLHPELLHLLAGLFQDAALRTDLIVATHSPDLIRWLQPNEVLVLDKEDGRTRLTWADTLNLEDWLKEYTLSELWLMGTLGGRS